MQVSLQSAPLHVLSCSKEMQHHPMEAGNKNNKASSLKYGLSCLQRLCSFDLAELTGLLKRPIKETFF